MKNNNKTLAFACAAACVCIPIPFANIAYAQQATSENDSATDEIEQITIVSGIFAQPVNELSSSVVILNSDDLQSRYQLSLADTLRTISGINVSNSGGVGKVTAVRIRGEESFRTRLYIDGMEISDPTAPQLTPIFDDLLLEDITRVELLKGPQGLLYGADAGGIISVSTTNAGKGLSGNASAEFGSESLKRFSASLSAGNDSSSVFLAVSDFATDGFNAQSTDTSGEIDPYDNTSVHLRANHQFNDKFSAQVVVRNTEGETQYDGCFDNSTFAPTNDCLTESEQTSGRLSLNYQADTSEHQLGYSKTDVTRDFSSNGEFGFGNDGTVTRLDYAGRIAWQDNQVTFGVDLREEKDNNSGNSRDNDGYFAEWLYQSPDGFNFNLGLRFDDNETFGDYTSMRTGVNYSFPLEKGGLLQFKSTYGTGFRAPSLFEQAYNDGPFAFGDAAGLQLTEEKSKGFDIGFVHRLSDTSWWSLTWFDQSIENEIQFDAVAFQGYLQTDGESQSQGLEFEAETVVATRHKIWFNYTLMDTEDQTGNQRLRRPDHLANIGYELAISEKLNWSLYAHMERGAVDIGNTLLDNYVIWHANINWQINDTISVSAYANNLLDKDYIEVAGFNTAGRELGVRLAVSY